MKFLTMLFHIFDFWSKNRIRYERIRDDESLRPYSGAMGMRSIIYTVTGAILSMLLIWAIVALLKWVETLLMLFVIIFIMGCAIGVVICVLKGIFGGLLCWIYQLRLNKKPIGFVALAIWVLFTLAAIVGAILFVMIVMPNL